MKIALSVDHYKDKTKKTKRVMMVGITTDIPGMEKIQTVAELPDDSILAKELDMIVTEMLALKKEAIGKENKKKLTTKKKTNEKINISKKTR